MVSDGSGKPVRMHIRGPSFYNLQSIDPMVHGQPRRRRGRDRLEHRPDHGRGRPVSCFTDANLRRARSEIVARVPAAEVGDPAARAPRAGPGRLAHRRGDGRDRRAHRASPPAEVLRDVLPSTRCSSARPCGKLVVSVCTNVTCLVAGGPEILEHLEDAATRPTTDVTVEEVECLAACGGAPAMQVNYEFHERRDARRRPSASSRSYRRGSAPCTAARHLAARRQRDRPSAGRAPASSRKRLHDRPDDSWTIDGALASRRRLHLDGYVARRLRSLRKALTDRPTCRSR